MMGGLPPTFLRAAAIVNPGPVAQTEVEFVIEFVVVEKNIISLPTFRIVGRDAFMAEHPNWSGGSSTFVRRMTSDQETGSHANDSDAVRFAIPGEAVRHPSGPGDSEQQHREDGYGHGGGKLKQKAEHTAIVTPPAAAGSAAFRW